MNNLITSIKVSLLKAKYESKLNGAKRKARKSHDAYEITYQTQRYWYYTRKLNELHGIEITTKEVM